MEVGRLKGQGREREGKGKGKGRGGKGKEGNGKEGNGKGKGINLISSVLVCFETVSKYRNKPKQTERGDYILSEKIPKQNRNCQCFGLFRYEPKEKKSVSQDTLLDILIYPERPFFFPLFPK